jgi:hypothetical protein
MFNSSYVWLISNIDSVRLVSYLFGMVGLFLLGHVSQ